MENMAFLIIETTVAGGVVCATLTRPNTISDICCVDRYSSVYAGPAGNHRIEVVAEMIRRRLLPRVEGHVRLVWGGQGNDRMGLGPPAIALQRWFC